LTLAKGFASVEVDLKLQAANIKKEKTKSLLK
jgi:copper chaperone CopZ